MLFRLRVLFNSPLVRRFNFMFSTNKDSSNDDCKKFNIMILPITETEYLVAVTYKLQNKNVLYTFIYFF